MRQLLDSAGGGLSLLRRQEEEDLALKEREKVVDEIEGRHTFSYRYRRFFLFNNFEKSYCFCCKPKRNREDHLFKSARGKLNEELDILEIVKKLRVS